MASPADLADDIFLVAEFLDCLTQRDVDDPDQKTRLRLFAVYDTSTSI